MLCHQWKPIQSNGMESKHRVAGGAAQATTFWLGRQHLWVAMTTFAWGQDDHRPAARKNVIKIQNANAACYR